MPFAKLQKLAIGFFEIHLVKINTAIIMSEINLRSTEL